MSNPNDAPTEVLDTPSQAAVDIFGDASNPAVEQAIAAESGSGSTIEPVVPAAVVPDLTGMVPPDGGTTHVDEPVVPVTPAAPVATPAVQYTPDQIAAFQQWQVAQQQQVIPFTPPQQVAPAAPVQQQQPLAQADIDKAINRYTVTPEAFNSLFNEPDPAKAAGILNSMLQGAVIQAVTMAHHLNQQTASELTQRVQPYMQFADTQREQMLREQFFAHNADLKGQDALIQTVMAQMAQERRSGAYRPVSEAQVFTDVATRTKALIAGMQQQGQIPAASNGAPRQAASAGTKPQMAVLPNSGGGGSQSAGTSQARPGESSAARSIFA